MDSAIVPLNWRPNGWGRAPNWRSSRPCNARWSRSGGRAWIARCNARPAKTARSEEHTSELQSQSNLVCRLLLEKKKKKGLHVSDDMYECGPSVMLAIL